MSTETPKHSARAVVITIALALGSIPFAAFVWGWLAEDFSTGLIYGWGTTIFLGCLASNMSGPPPGSRRRRR